MKLPNDIEIKQCLYTILGVTTATIIAVFLDIPILRQVISFLFLAFVPGILLLRILKIHNLSMIENLTYTVGLSLAFVMLSSVLINLVLPILGLEQPLSLLPLLISLGILVLILCSIAYKRDKGFNAPKQTILPIAFSAPQVFLIMLLVSAIAGALIMNYYGNNILSLIFLIAITITIGLISFNKFIPEKTYSLAIMVIALALLYNVTLSSSVMNLGGDIHSELLYAGRVLDSNYWDFSVGGAISTALSIVIICPIYSTILNMDAIWIFKIIYPLFFCLVPLVLFHIYRQQFGAKVAFLATFFFISVLYYTEMLSLYRQQIAELFFALVILLLIEHNLPLVKKTILVTIFATSIIMTHYALGYICAGLFIIAWLLLFFKHRIDRAFPQKVLTGILLIYLVAGIGWYSFVGGGQSIRHFQRIVSEQTDTVVETINKPNPEKTKAFFDFSEREPLVRTALGLDFWGVSPQGKGFRILQYITQLFIIIGFIGLVFRTKRQRFKLEFLALSIGAMGFILACILLPNFSGYLESERFYQIGLMLLAPICILGGQTIWQVFKPNSHYLASIVLILYFIYTSGFIFEITNCSERNIVDTPSSMALSGHRFETDR